MTDPVFEQNGKQATITENLKRRDPEKYARLKAEAKAPYRGLRKFVYSNLRSNPPREELSNRLKEEATMIKPIESIFIRNSIYSQSDCSIKSLRCASFSRTENFF